MKHPKKALVIVDNDDAISHIMEIVFKEYGFFVFHVKTAACLFKILHSINPEIILMDYWIDGDETGAEAVAAMEKEQELRKIPVLFMTTSEFRKNIEHLTCHKLFKPFELSELIDKVLDITA